MPIDTSKFQFVADALSASGGFSPQAAATYAANSDSGTPIKNTHLVQYPRESAQKFNRRNQVAVYRNFLHSACSRFNGYLFSKSANRQTNNPLFKVMLDDLDRRGNAAAIFWQDFALNAKARGSMLVLVDMPAELPANMADQVNQRAAPYFLPIAPESIAAAAVNDRGLFDWMAFPVIHAGKAAWKVWDAEEWRIQEPKIDGVVFERGTHPVGECPVLIFTESGEFPHIGEFSQIAELSRAWFNQVSSRDEILRGNAFPVLTYQIGENELAENVANNLTIGVSNAILYRGERPGYVSPESTSLDVHERAIDKLEQAIQEIGYHIDLSGQAEAAAALSLRYRNLSSALTLFSARLMDFERRCWYVAARWLGINDAPAIDWPTSYDIADIGGELLILQQMQASGFAPEVIAEQQARIIRLQYQGLEDADLERLLNASANVEHVPPDLQPAPV